MGLLDDAIREHLDLKRRRGADPAEIERAEREALGPVRRRGDPEDPLDEVEQSQPAVATQEPPGEPSYAEPRTSSDENGVAGSAPDRLDDQRAPEPVDRDDVEPARSAASAPPPVPAVPPPYLPVTPPGAEPQVEEHPSVDAPTEVHEIEHDDPDDPLEETPEFLQDAPEHDRLWFEQRPPRDFDFDG